MPMMRRGPLDRYPPESVLRQASAHQVTGGIEFHSDAPATFYFSNGRVYAASAGVDLGPEGPDAAATDEVTARGGAVALLATSLAAQDGWYYHDPLTRHRSLGEWDWDTASLIMESRSHRAAAAKAASTPATPAASAAPQAAPAPPVDQVVQLVDAGASSVSLGPDAWSLVVALAGSGSVSALAEQMGWDRRRIDAALGELDARGALSRRSAGEPAAATTAAAPLSVPDGALAAGSNGRHVGPLTPPPTLEPAPPPTKGRRRRRR